VLGTTSTSASWSSATTPGGGSAPASETPGVRAQRAAKSLAQRVLLRQREDEFLRHPLGRDMKILQ